ncbi:hypothetical protein DFH29DRAFT_880321 [Suillus ampliporus]|nr:hypothetical protein DFH29DRAFT_880321 [Suillus ampliporus]
MHMPPTQIVRRSTWAKVHTATGQAWITDMETAKACFQALQESQAACVAVSSCEGVVIEEEEVIERAERDGEAEENLEEIEPNSDIPEVYANVMIEEHANISIQSDQK